MQILAYGDEMLQRKKLPPRSEFVFDILGNRPMTEPGRTPRLLHGEFVRLVPKVRLLPILNVLVQMKQILK